MTVDIWEKTLYNSTLKPHRQLAGEWIFQEKSFFRHTITRNVVVWRFCAKKSLTKGETE